MNLAECLDHDRSSLARAHDVGVAPRREVLRDDLTGLINEDELRLGAAAVDANFVRCRVVHDRKTNR